MSSSQTPVGFTVQELYTRILPGLVIVLSVSIPPIITNRIEGGSIEIPLTFTNTLLLIGLVSLVAGEIINIIRELISIPYWFRLIVYEGTSDKSHLGWRLQLLMIVWPRTIDKNLEYITEIVESTTLDDDLYRNICNKLGFDPESVKPRLLYMGLMNHMDSQMSSLTRRHQMNYNFTENVWISLMLGLFLNLAIIIVHLFGEVTGLYNASESIIISSFIVVIILTILYLLWWVIVSMASGLYLQYLLIDYLSGDSQHLNKHPSS